MPNLDWSQCPAVESIPGKVSGAWVFKNTRMPVQTIFDNLEAVSSVAEITEVFEVTKEEVVATIHFVTESLDVSGPKARPIPAWGETPGHGSTIRQSAEGATYSSP